MEAFATLVHFVDGFRAAAYVPVLLKEKVLTPLKDIAIYRLGRIEKAIERLGAAVTRLESATQSDKSAKAASLAKNAEDTAILLELEMANLKKDYAALYVAAGTVVERLDATIGRLTTDAAETS